MDQEFVQLLLIKVYTAGMGNFAFFCSCDLDFDPMTFIYELDPIPSKCTNGPRIN